MRRVLFAFTLAISLVGVAHADTSMCPVFTRILQPGMRGSDVSSLQAYLALDRNVYPEGVTSGYYGQLTTLAVQRFQAAHGIIDYGTPSVTGWGVVGPKTRASIMHACAHIGTTTATPGDVPRVGGVTVTPLPSDAPAEPGAMWLRLTAPPASTTARRGTTLSISWVSTSTPSGAAVALWLVRVVGNETVGLLAQGLPTTGTYGWPVPANTPKCNLSNPIECISMYAGLLCPANTIAVCASSVTDGLYRIAARVYTPGNAAVGRTWNERSAATMYAGAMSASFTVASSTRLFEDGYSTTTVASTSSNTDTGGPSGACQYVIDGKWYESGMRYNACCTTLSPTKGAIQCAAASDTLQCPYMRCVGGGWMREDASNLPSSQAGGCTTPWGGATVLNGHAVADSPYFTNGTYSMVDPQPRHVCDNGYWKTQGTCADDGPGCYNQ